MPCLDEAESVATCIHKARCCLETLGVSHEILVADNGSTDGSPEIAETAGARVVPVAAKGYGSALLGGFAEARGTYVVMGDADDSYDFAGLGPFLERLRAGADLVMGNRFRGGIAPGAMPPLHRYLGNPLLTGVLNLLFRAGIGDAHCGLRAFRRDALPRMGLVTTGMELASEMVIKAARAGLRIEEVPTTLQAAGRSRAPHLRSWRDGWRHLRFMLLHAPTWVFLGPGLTLLLVGLAGATIIGVQDLRIGGAVLTYNSMIFSGALMLAGAQAAWLGICARIYVQTQIFGRALESLGPLARAVTLERPLVLGAGLGLAGLALLGVTLWSWVAADFGDLDYARIKVSLLGAFLLLLGLQMIFNSFFVGMLLIPKRGPGRSPPREAPSPETPQPSSSPSHS